MIMNIEICWNTPGRGAGQKITEFKGTVLSCSWGQSQVSKDLRNLKASVRTFTSVVERLKTFGSIWAGEKFETTRRCSAIVVSNLIHQLVTVD